MNHIKHKESIVTPDWIYLDPLALALLKFISVRPQSMKNREAYAAAFVSNDGTVHALGRNMQVEKTEGWKVMQGYANYAEMMSYSVATRLSPAITGGIIYVIGFLGEQNIFLHKKLPHGQRSTERFTCSLCAKKMCEHQIRGIALPTASNWKKLSTKQSLSTALSFETQAKQTGKNVARKRERLTIPPQFVTQLVNYLQETPSSQLIKKLEQYYTLTPFTVAILHAANGGYVATDDYKKIVFNQK